MRSTLVARRLLFALAGAAALLLGLADLHAWHAPGHQAATRAALAALPPALPAFFRQGAAAVAHHCIDPDLLRNPATPELGDREAPDHFLDLELLQGKPLPPTRYEYYKLLDSLAVKPQAAGALPYALLEATQRLTLAFAEHRKWPDNPHVQNKCLLYAGLLAHYAEDLCQPLHCTIHFDGHAKPDGSSPRAGIHFRVDGLLDHVPEAERPLPPDLQPVAFAQLLPAIVAELERSAKLVDRVYELAPGLPDPHTPGAPLPPAAAAFARDRFHAATRFTASLYLTAWDNSAKVEFPKWLDREGGK